MLNPSIGKLITKEDNRYRLVLEVAKQARKITDDARAEGEIIIEKPVTVAMNELAEKLDK